MRHQLIQGDSLEVLPQLPDSSVGAVITDPPYSSGGLFRSDRLVDTRIKYLPENTREYLPFSGDNRDQRSYAFWCTMWLAQCYRIAQPGAVLCVFSDWRQMPTTTDAVQAGGWTWRGLVAWDKTEAARPDKGRFRNQCEYVVWGSKGPLPLDEDADCLPGVFRHYQKPQDKAHIASKPVALLRELLRICPEGSTVLDPFMGGGNVGMACMETGHGFVGIEVDRHCFELARDRIGESLTLFTEAAVLEVKGPPVRQIELCLTLQPGWENTS